MFPAADACMSSPAAATFTQELEDVTFKPKIISENKDTGGVPVVRAQLRVSFSWSLSP